MYPYASIDVVEVWNGPWTSDQPWQADNESALAEWGRTLGADIHSGQWRPAMGNSDTHYEGQLGIPHTVVWAESLTPGAILAGIRAGRSWIAASTDVSLSVTASTGERSAGIGERLAAPPDAPVACRFALAAAAPVAACPRPHATCPAPATPARRWASRGWKPRVLVCISGADVQPTGDTGRTAELIRCGGRTPGVHR